MTMNRAPSKQVKHVCLVVEDSQFDQEKIRRILDRGVKDLDVVMTATLEEARNALEETTFSLVLLDNNLPDGSGADLAVELAEDPRFKHIPVVMVSDWPTPFMYHKAKSAGVVHIVNKTEFGARFVHSALERLKGYYPRLA